MKISKKGGITIFCLAGLVLSLVIIFHQNKGIVANPQPDLIRQEMIKKM